jgi:CheY-like chemotaxis protein
MHGSLDDIARAARSAASLTRQLLTFSRKQILTPRTIDLNALVARSEKMLRRLIPENIEVKAVLADDLGPVEMDETQLEQIIVNLGVNARDAMPDGGTLLLTTSSVDLDGRAASTRAGVVPGRYVTLAVSDTGHGMTEEVRQRVFEPFFTTKPIGQGTGLGLATAYAAVQQANGFLEVVSAPGRGTRLTIHLPNAHASSLPQPEAVTAAPESAATDGTILLVEDDDMVRSLAYEVLRQAGYRVIQAANGAEACELFSSDPASIDMLVTDVMMPGINGRELADRITNERPDIHVLFASGYDDSLIAEHDVLPAGVNFISKPYTPTTLRRKVGGILAGHDGMA